MKAARMPGAAGGPPKEGFTPKGKWTYTEKRVADSFARHPSSMKKRACYYHQGPPATKAAAVPSAAPSSASLSLMGPSFHKR